MTELDKKIKDLKDFIKQKTDQGTANYLGKEIREICGMVETEQCTIHSVTCSLCTEKDKMYSFKVRDYTTEIVGRKNEEGNFFYIQRGDGAVHKYDADRVTQAFELNYR